MEVDSGSASSVRVGALYEAAKAGSVTSLDALLQQHDTLILHEVSLTTFSRTPLHLAALLGHLEFSERLLTLIPKMALEQDSDKCTPLHLAAANGHDHVVRELLKGPGTEEACLIQDQKGRVPLHLGAMRGRVPVVLELLKSAHAEQSLKMKIKDGDGILHLCVKCNQLDVLKVVVDSTRDGGKEVLNMTDSRGNTVLHLAVMRKRIEIVSFLLSRVSIEVINTLNGMNFTALDVVNHSLEDFETLEIRQIFGTALGRVEAVQPATITQTLGADQRRDNDEAIEVADQAEEHNNVEAWTWTERAWQYVKRLMDYRGDWINDTRGCLMMVSTIIATITFQAGISPPGGVWQQDISESIAGPGNPCNETICAAGSAVLAYYYPQEYVDFMKYDMVSFLCSLAILFLLTSGFPLNNKFCLWFLSLAMCVTVSFLVLAFLQATLLVIPDIVIHRFIKFKDWSLYVWLAVICTVSLSLIVRLSSWLRSMYNSRQSKDLRRKLSALSSSMSRKSTLACANMREENTNRC